MMGERQSGQDALFYEFSLERHVPAEHLLRSIDRFVELDGLRCELAPFYSEKGRPSIDPELMIRMLIVGYCFGIRSERRLCQEVHLNLAYRWFCRLGLDGTVPDHSTFSKNRHGRFRESDLLRQVFDTTVRRCMAEGLVGGDGFAVDASMIKADANRQRSVPGSEWQCPEAANHAVREYLSVLDDAAFGAATPVVPKFISHADPASRWTGANGGLAFFAYCTNYLIDLKHAVILDVEATTAVRQAEVTAQQRMIDRTQERFGLWPERLAADAAYGSAENLAWLVHERAIEPHIPVFDKSQRTDGTFSRDDFAYDRERDCYICPAGKELRKRQKIYRVPRPLVDEDGMMRYRASKAGLRVLSPETVLLSHGTRPQDPALHSRGRSRHGARHRGHRRLCHLKARTKEGRDAVRAPEAYSEARSVAITRTKRRPRRVPPRRHCPKPPQARHADPNANADLSNVKRHHRSSAFSRMRAIATATT